MQVDPIKPTLKAPGMNGLKLKYDDPHLNFGFKINLRRYSKATWKVVKVGRCSLTLSNPR